MNLWLRLIRVLLASFFRPPLGLMDVSVVRFRVMPHDLDVNLHMTNSRYLALMDLGRLETITRTGLWRIAMRERWSPVIAAAYSRFRRPLRLFQPIVLRTRLLTWDEKWLYIEHRIEANGDLACHTVVRGAFVRNGKVVIPAEIAAVVGVSGEAPPPPDWLEPMLDGWRSLDGNGKALPESNSPSLSLHLH